MKNKQPLQQKDMSQSELVTLLMGVSGAKFATLVTETPVDMNKTGNPFANRNVTKLATTNVTLNFNYSNSAQKKGIVVAGTGRKWGGRIASSPILINKGETYVHSKPNAKAQKVTYLLDSREMTSEEITQMNPYLRHRAAAPVPVMDVKLNNIKEIKIDKQHFIIK